jgi:hypothetical protein
MNEFLDTLNALIVANGLDPDTVTLAQLIRLYTNGDTGPNESEFDHRGFGKPSENGSVRIKGIEKLRAALKEAGREDIAKLVPEWHITDFWNENQSTSLEGINKLQISDYAKAFLNRNLNRWFFLPGGVSGTPTIPPNFNYYISGLQSPWGGVWSSYDAGRRAPFFGALDVTLRPATATSREEYVLTRDTIDGTYVWPMSVDCSTTDFHVGYWKAYAEAVTGLQFKL